MNKHILAMAFFAALGCSSVESDVDAGHELEADAGPTLPTLDDWLAADLHYGCQIYVCFFGVAPSESEAFCGDEPEKRYLRQQAVADGRMTFDARAAKDCVEALEPLATTCWGPEADLEAWDPVLEGACDRVLAGTVASGGACWFDEECATGSCSASGDTCPGVCRPPVVEGGACSRNAMCDTGLTCSGSKCVRPVTEETPLPAGSPCDVFSTPCEPHLRCASASVGASPTCVDRLEEGAACRRPGAGLGISSPECRGNMVCRGLMLDDQGEVLVEGECATPGDVGGACSPRLGHPGKDESSTGCFLGILCDETTERCVSLPGDGEACVQDECDQTAYCDRGTCRALKTDGESCTDSSECLNVCLASTNKCAPSPATARCLP